MSCNDIHSHETFACIQASFKPLLLKPVHQVFLIESLKVANLFIENGRPVSFGDTEKSEEVGEREVGDEAEAGHVQHKFEEVS